MLRVTKLTDYATVVLTILANQDSGVLSANALANRSGLEFPTVHKLLKPLARAGLVTGCRGVQGGYCLARPAQQITLMDIIQAMEGPLAITQCHWNDEACSLAPRCHLRPHWRVVNDVIAKALERMTLAQMLPPASSPNHSRSTAVHTASANSVLVSLD